mmetsp:Transcript_22363/g.46335  ORF Transcript_22363/g.46335 Transcript_22363/m.46335 type:complete len:313 (-) Transcript_22363:264-1202(-)
MRRRHSNDILAQIVQLSIVLLGYDDRRTASRLHLLDVGLDLRVSRIRARSDEHHRHELVNQSDRSMLHLGSWVALGMDVGDLLALHCPLQRYGEVESAPQEDEVVGEDVLAAQVPQHALADGDVLLLRLLPQRLHLVVQHVLHVAGELLELCQQLFAVLLCEGAGLCAQRHREKHQCQERGGEYLRGSDSYLLASQRLHEGVALPSDRRACHVDKSQSQHLAAVLAPLHRSETLDRVTGLAGAGDDDEDVARFDQGLPVPILRSILHVYGDAGNTLNGIFCKERGMPRGPRPQNGDPVLEPARSNICHYLQR